MRRATKRLGMLLGACTALFRCAPHAGDVASSGGGEVLGAAQNVPKKLQFEFCWQDSPHADHSARARVEEVLRFEYAKTPIMLSGFKPCGSRATDGGIYKIYEYDSNEWGPQVSGIGTKATYSRVLNGVHWNVILNHSFNNWSQSCNADEEARDNCITAIALHEVGHLVGLRHEHSRSDSTCLDWKEELGEGGVAVGLYDPGSIMNYCENGSYSYSQKPRRLSSADIATIWTLYAHLYSEGWFAKVENLGGTMLKRTPSATQTEDRCQLGQGSSWPFEFLGVTADNHLKVRLLSQDVIAACRSRIDGDTAYLFPRHFRFWR